MTNTAVATLDAGWTTSDDQCVGYVDTMGNADSTAGIQVTTTLSCGCSGWCTCYTHYHCVYPWYPLTTPEKVRLSVAEFNRLRAAAKKDKKLAGVLEKLTELIEVEVTFT